MPSRNKPRIIIADSYASVRRRRADSCIAVKIWHSAALYITVIGFLSTIVSVIFTGGGKWSEVDAYAGRLDQLEAWQKQQATDTAEIKQSVKDIHNYLLPLHHNNRAMTDD